MCESKLFLLVRIVEEPEVTTISEKGQVVIPQSIRKELGIKPKNKFVVYGRGDTIILKKLDLPNLKKEWEEIFKQMDKKELKVSEDEILKEIADARKETR
jgi:AbrB family looped-hinge helix DNA binding protein